MERLQLFPEMLFSVLASTYFYVIAAWLAWSIGTNVGGAMGHYGLEPSVSLWLLWGLFPLVVLPLVHPVAVLLDILLLGAFVGGFYSDERKWRVGAIVLMGATGVWSGYLVMH